MDPLQASPLLALVCSVALEAEAVQRRLRGARPLVVGRKPAVEGRLAGRPVILLTAGMGKTNAAQGLTALLESRAVQGVIGFGVGGAYAGTGLAPGALALATSEVYGDEGVGAPGGWLSTEGIGIPLLERGGVRTYNEFPLDPVRVGAAERALASAGMRAGTGPFVTVSCCSGTLAQGRALAERFAAVCESMEGAAYAHVAAIYGAPFQEVRGISNRVEDRDLSRWRLGEAAEAAGEAVQALVGGWAD